MLEGIEDGLGDSGVLVDGQVWATEVSLIRVDELQYLLPVL